MDGSLDSTARQLFPAVTHAWIAVLLCGLSPIVSGLLDHRQLARALGTAERDKKTQTLARLTPSGNEKVEGSWREMEELRKGAAGWRFLGELVSAT